LEKIAKPQTPLALAGYRVLDLTGEIGHYCGKMLGDMGADVIKIEPPGGDPVRFIGPYYKDQRDPDKSLRWFSANTSKRGVTLDLSKPQGRRIMEKLLPTAQVIVTSWTRKEAQALGMDEAAVRRRYPNLIYTSITGYGLDGPYANYRWADITGMALGGLMYLMGDPDRPPIVFRAPQAYFHASSQGALGTALALYHRTRTGIGQLLDVSMQEAVTFNLNGPGTIVSWWTVEKSGIRREGGSLNFRFIKWHVMLPCKDGYTANTGVLGWDKFPVLRDLMAKEGVAEDLLDPKWESATSFPPGPGQWQCTQAELDYVYDVFTKWQMRHTKEEILELAVKHALPVFPVNASDDLLHSRQLEAREYWIDVPHPELGTTIRYPGGHVKLSGTPMRISRRAPLIGEHNTEIYRDELGISESELRDLRAAKVL